MKDLLWNDKYRDLNPNNCYIIKKKCYMIHTHKNVLFGFSAGYLIHILLVIAVIAVIIRIIQGIRFL